MSQRTGDDKPDTPLISRMLALPRELLHDVGWAVAFYFCAMAGYFVLQPLRETLVSHQQEKLPDYVKITAGVMLVAQFAFSALAAKVAGRRLVPFAFRGFQFALLGFAVLFATTDPFTHGPTVTFYVFVNVFILFVQSLFWIAQVEAWSEFDAKRVFGTIALGGTLGGIVGPQLTKLLMGTVGIVGVVITSVVLIELALWCGRQMKRARMADNAHQPAPSESLAKHAFEGVVETARSPYLLAITGFMLLYSFTGSFLWFAKQHFANLAYGGDRDGRLAFFANLTSIGEVVTLVLQLFVASRFVSRFGVVVGLCVVPVFTLVGFGAVWAIAALGLPTPTILGTTAVWMAPTLVALAVFEVGRKALWYSVSRPVKEVLFTVLSRVQKTKAKAFIDTVVYRLGDAAASEVYDRTGDTGTRLFVPVPLAAVWAVLAVGLGLAQRRQAKRMAQAATNAATTLG